MESSVRYELTDPEGNRRDDQALSQSMVDRLMNKGWSVTPLPESSISSADWVIGLIGGPQG
jgi:hypothetical protein